VNSGPLLILLGLAYWNGPGDTVASPGSPGQLRGGGA